MLAVGLTGGIGSGKSAVADMLVERGAVLIDADRIAREVVEPTKQAYVSLVERFGEGILAADGTIDRSALAAVTFSDPKALADLNAITHPAIGAEMARRRDDLQETAAIVILDVPLLSPKHRELLSLDVVVVVDTTPEIALERLVKLRGMSEADARARMEVQASREERLTGADVVIRNDGSLEELARQVDKAFEQLTERNRAKRTR